MNFLAASIFQAVNAWLWRRVAAIASRPAVALWLIRRAQRTPYTPITSATDSQAVYMWRWWLFNPYTATDSGREVKRWPLLPSVRIHHICRADSDRHLHDHPWNARTVVLDGSYMEERAHVIHERARGYTGRLLFGEYHRIRSVSPGGVTTLFFTWRQRGDWGFLVDGAKVPFREYLAHPERFAEDASA